MALRSTVRQQFKQHKDETDEAQIEALKANAIRGLSNYMLFQSAKKDDHLQKAMTDQATSVKDDNSKGDSESDKTS